MQNTGVMGTKQVLMGILIAAVVMLAQPVMAAGPWPVDLGSAGHFTILSGATITTTGGGIINGDVGASPITGSAILVTQVKLTVLSMRSMPVGLRAR